MADGIREIGMRAGGFTYASPDGAAVSAPIEVWIAAMITLLPEADRIRLLRGVDKIMKSQMDIFAADGKRYRVAKESG